ncbi:lactate utilization protein C [Nakamurella sp.]|uniref:lactate utilization protein C n=1 Tax=Nakamurella sp. TaxID=1869182 RepID=UPI0037848005
MSSRETVLNRIRDALAADVSAPPPIPRDYIRVGDPPGSPPVLELMVDRLVDYKAHVREVTTDELADAIDTALTDARTVVVAADLNPDLKAAAARSARTVTTDGTPTVLTPNELDSIDAVLTTATVAIALSGTITLDGGPGQGRRAITLIPDTHLVVLYADQIVHTVPEAINRLDPTRPLTMIAGPSATSDIELERVEGVHGPRTLSVLIVR